MKRSREPIPKSRSEFIQVKCPDCGEERVVFSCATKNVGCHGCGRQLLQSRGGKAIILAPIIKRFD